MTINHSDSLELNLFEYIFIDNDAANIREIMTFCGVCESDLEQEIIFHNGGDSYQCLNDKDVHQLERHYLVKIDNTIVSFAECDFNHLFKQGQ